MTHIEAVPQPDLPNPPTVYYQRITPHQYKVTVAGPPPLHLLSYLLVQRVVDYAADGFSERDYSWIVRRGLNMIWLTAELKGLNVPLQRSNHDQPGVPSDELPGEPATDGDNRRSDGGTR